MPECEVADLTPLQGWDVLKPENKGKTRHIFILNKAIKGQLPKFVKKSF